MVFDLSNTQFTVYFDGNLYQGSAYEHTLQLKSRYSNNYILNDEDTGDGGPYFILTILEYNDRYTKAEVDFTNADLQTLEVEGYYQWIVGYAGELVQEGLAKVINTSDESGSTRIVPYQSPNDSNETIVYFQ